MQHVLVHIDQGLGPIGAWGYTDRGKLTHFYPESLDVAISGRARLLMAQRHDDVSIPEWMDFLAEAEPTMLDEFQTFSVVNEQQSLSLILAEFRRTWVSSSD
jgi:hypothetical protein